MRALVVDDSRAMRAIIRRYLSELGFAVDEAGDGEQGLRQLDANAAEGVKPTVMLVDWNMPVMDGYAFIKAVRSERQWADVPIIMVSAENDRTKIARALMAGADEYAMKPITLEILESKLALLGLG